MEITTTLCLPLILVLSNCMFMQKKYTSILEEAEQSVRKADSGGSEGISLKSAVYLVSLLATSLYAISTSLSLGQVLVNSSLL